MLGLILVIIGVIAAGLIVAYAIIMTFIWLKNKVKEKLAQKSAKKEAVLDLKELVREAAKQSDNKVKMDELEKTVEKYDYCMATIDDDGEILGEVDLIEDENETLDAEIEELLSRDRSRIVIFEN